MGEISRENKIHIDGLFKKDRRMEFFDLPLSSYVKKYKNESVLFSRYGRTESFFTENSRLYITPSEFRKMKRGERLARISGRMDSLSSRQFLRTRIYVANRQDLVYLQIKRRYSSFSNYMADLAKGSVRTISPVKMWNLSIVGAIIFGMLTMTMIYKYLGQNVSAKIEEASINAEKQNQASDFGNAGDQENSDDNSFIDATYITKLLENSSDKAQGDFEKEIMEMVKGYPIEEMVPEIAKKDRTVAAFLIGIAKQESTWGKHVPVYNGEDCYNYWGWRGKNPVATGGHTCFASPQEAIDTVSKRIEFLVSNKKLNTPAKMIVWKCGDCSWDNASAMNRWINEVSLYFKKLNK